MLTRQLAAATVTTTIDSIAVIDFSFALYPYMCVSHGMRLYHTDRRATGTRKLPDDVFVVFIGCMHDTPTQQRNPTPSN